MSGLHPPTERLHSKVSSAFLISQLWYLTSLKLLLEIIDGKFWKKKRHHPVKGKEELRR